MQSNFYPENKTVLGVFSTYSRYGGAREAIFTALCRKNYGCSHFIVGRDHTGSGYSTNNLNENKAVALFNDLGIEILTFNDVYFSKSKNDYIEKVNNLDPDDVMSISGTKAREILKSLQIPPTWFMRKEVSEMIINSIRNNEEVFVK